MRQAHNSHSFNKPSNSIYFMTAITIGIPALALIALIETNSAIEKGMLGTVTMFLVFSALIVGLIFEIKRLADQPSDIEQN